MMNSKVARGYFARRCAALRVRPGRFAAPFLAALLSWGWPGTVAAAADAGGDGAPRWLMLVATKNMDPSREDAFNHWYDDVDIPDVLKVAGYRRARRAVRQPLPGMDVARIEAAEGRYLALYDIETESMDRTIIDMLMAARKMDMTGRSIDALKVTERVYFRRLGAVEIASPKTSGKPTFLYLERVSCCRDDASMAALNDWYDHTRLPDAARAAIPGLERVTRFEVHRVVMVEPKQVPRFLTLYELSADSADAAASAMRGLNERMAKADRLSEWFVEEGSALVRQIRDVRH